MSDDDQLDRASTHPLPAVTGADDQQRTQPLIEGSDVIPDPPTTPHQSALHRSPDEAEFTEMIPADLAMPGDETGAIASSSVFEDVPTQELQDDQTLVPQSSPSLIEDDVTNPGGVSDDAIVRRVVLPLDPPTEPLPDLGPHTQPTELPAGPMTVPTELPPKRPDPLPAAQLPPARGPVPLPRFQARANHNETRAADAPSIPLAADDTRIWGVALLFAIAWGLLANVLAAWQWLAPPRMFVITLVAIVPVAAAVGFVARPPHRSFERQDLEPLARPIGSAALILLIAALPWQIGLVREAMRGIAGDSPEMMREVLQDRSGTVALAECRRLAPDFAKPGVGDVLAETLADRPQVVRQCLQSAPDIAELLSSALVRSWYDVLVAPDTAPDRACKVADSIAQLKRPPGEVETRLLGCIMFGAPDAQRCCATTLAEGNTTLDWVARVQGQTGYVPDEQTAAGLLALTFGSDEISAEQAQFVKDADFRGTEAKRMAVVLGCAAVANRAAIGPQFIANLPTSCPVQRDELPTDSETWTAICDASIDRLVRRRGDPAETLCLGARSFATELAVAEAVTKIRASVGKSRNQSR